MSKYTSQIVIAAIGAIAAVIIVWLGVLAFHPNSTFVLDVKLWFHIP